MSDQLDYRYIFGVTMTISFIRSSSRDLCAAIAQGFGLGETDGDTAYQYFITEGHPEATAAFTSVPYSTYENSTKSLFLSYYPSLSDYQAGIYAIVAQAMLFAYATNQCVSVKEFQKLIGEVLTNVAPVIGGSVFQTVNKVIITPFSSLEVMRQYLALDYSATAAILSSDSRTIEAPLTNYNWYDASSLFRGPEIQVMKDIENQYYMITGKLIYQNMVGRVDDCIEDVVTIPTRTGDAEFSYIRNPPCRQADTYVGPVDYVSFARVFNDGPSSSGYFDTGVSGFYLDNDRAVLEQSSFMTNSRMLYNYGGQLYASAFVDENGRYDLINGDYLNMPMQWGCTQPYQRMHIGDDRSRTICNRKTCSCTLQTEITGFKYVAVQMPDEIWSYSTQFRQTNPWSTASGIRRRAWAISDNPYIATDVGGVLYPYFVGPAPDYIQYWYVGYPQLNGANILPELAFCQTFYNPTFGDDLTIALYPALATSYGDSTDGVYTTRSYEIGGNCLASGKAGAQSIEFVDYVSAKQPNEVSKKFFGMGDAFAGKYDITLAAEENADFFYTGFSVYEGGVLINSQTLADAYSDKIIGKYKTMKFITGYRRTTDNAEFPMVNMLAFDSSGQQYTFSYMGSGGIYYPIQLYGWDYFCQAPEYYENTPGYEKQYEEQVVESYFPRYYEGPFSVEVRKFLYPNADAVDKIVQGKEHGLPCKVSFNLEIREEAVREIYCKYSFAPDGSESLPTMVRVVRTDVPAGLTANPKMTHMFVPDNSIYDRYYNFTAWGISESSVYDRYAGITSDKSLEFVDSGYAPIIKTVIDGDNYEFVPIGRNSLVYDSTISTLASLWFSNGRARQFDDYQQHIRKTAEGNTFFQTPAPRGLGLNHAYYGVSLPVTLYYVLPYFDLARNIGHSPDVVNEAFPKMLEIEGADSTYFSKFNGVQKSYFTGIDLMFGELIGGRRGSPIAEQEGGYHSYGIVGDRWLGASFTKFGTQVLTCANPTTVKQTCRMPSADEHFVLFNTDASGTDLWINGAYYSPFKETKNIEPLPKTLSIPYNADGVVGNISTTWSGGYLTFNILDFFPWRERTGITIDDDEWYYKSGLIIGPFDRDVELGILGTEYLLAASDFFINNERMSHYFYDWSSCDRNWIADTYPDRAIFTANRGQTNRQHEYSILAIIPSGKTVNMNVLSDITLDDTRSPDDPAYSMVGLSGDSTILTFKTHIPLNGNTWISGYHSGDPVRLDNLRFVGGAETKYRITHNGPTNMEGTYTFINYGRSGKIYPKPPTNEFTGLATVDEYGNLIYGSTATVPAYWKNYAIRNGVYFPFSGFREGSRISFTIRDLKVEYDIPPYQVVNLVSPSGQCMISGHLMYTGQADNCVFSEGVYLVNGTQNDVTSGVYNPCYVSDVLSRVPAEMFTAPTSTDSIAPVLKAPSSMLQREDQSKIEDGQRYLYLLREAPYNYNKMWWPALSDLETLNPGETIESVPPGDGLTFSDSTVLFSASQGQELPNGLTNPDISKSYVVSGIFQLYDSVATDAYINSWICITTGRGSSVTLNQDSLSSALVPIGTPLTMIAQGLV